MASALLSSKHAGNLYSIMDIATALHSAAGVENNAAITTKVDANLIRRAFAHPDNELVLQYESYFGCRRDKNVLYARRPVRTARNEAGVFVIGRFSSMEAAKRATVVRWHVEMDDHARAGLVQFLEESSKLRSPKKKRVATDISPEDIGENNVPRPPLVAIQRPIRPQHNIASSAVIHYTLDGRAGKRSLPSNGLILVRKLRENLLPGDGDENACVQKEYVAETYGVVQYWAPVGVS